MSDKYYAAGFAGRRGFMPLGYGKTQTAAMRDAFERLPDAFGFSEAGLRNSDVVEISEAGCDYIENHYGRVLPSEYQLGSIIHQDGAALAEVL